MKKNFLLTISLSFVFIWLSGCSGLQSLLATPTPIPSPTTLPYTSENLLNDLRAAGAEVEPGGMDEGQIFSVPTQLLTVNGVYVQFFEFASVAEAEMGAAGVSSDGGEISRPDPENPGSSVIMLPDWVATPHFFRRERVIVLYAGDSLSILRALESVMGTQFAGGLIPEEGTLPSQYKHTWRLPAPPPPRPGDVTLPTAWLGADGEEAVLGIISAFTFSDENVSVHGDPAIPSASIEANLHLAPDQSGVVIIAAEYGMIQSIEVWFRPWEEALEDFALFEGERIQGESNQEGDIFTHILNPLGTTEDLLLVVYIQFDNPKVNGDAFYYWRINPTATPTPPVLSEIARESLTIDLGDFQTKAELTYPAEGDGVYPTVILLHGSAPADMDYHRYSSWGVHELLSHNFLDIANYLTLRGFAVLRFNKHYVSGPQMVDWEKYSQNITLQLLLEDAEKVLAAAKANPHVDGKHIFILGYSEGSVIGASLAVQHPELAGLILQGAVTLPFRDNEKNQVLNVGIPYLRSLSPDGRVTPEIIERATMGSGGEIAKGVIWYFLDHAAAERGNVVINADLDQNGDGAISIDDEFLPALDELLNIEFGGASIYAAENALPSTTQQAANIKVPVLILQGENDSATPEKDVHQLEQALKLAGHFDYQLIVYPGLGHSLGPADTLIDDNSRPIDQRPLEDLVKWLRDHSR